MSPIRVFVVDDHPVFRLGLAAMIHEERPFEWAGEAAGGAEAVLRAPAQRPDLLLVDLVMPHMNGAATIEALRPLLPRSRFVVLTDVADSGLVRRAVAAGACGCLLKSVPKQELLTVMQAAARGHRMLAPGIAALAADGSPHAPGADLTQRERELLDLMARGLSNDRISTRLSIAMPTVKFHVTNILAKLQVGNRTEAVLKALRHELVRLD